MPTIDPRQAAGATVTVRLAERSDAAAITAILNHYVIHSTATFMTEPESVEHRAEWLDSRPAKHPVVVAELGGEVVGFASLSAFRVRAAYGQTAEVGVYVRHDCHRRGIGRALVTDIVERGRAAGLHVIVAGCCTESVASIGLLEAVGFTRVAHFHQVGRKFARWLDVVFLEMVL